MSKDSVLLGEIDFIFSEEIARIRRLQRFIQRVTTLKDMNALEERELRAGIADMDIDKIVTIIKGIRSRDFGTMTVVQLRKEAALSGIRGYQSMSKSQLIYELEKFYEIRRAT